MKPISLLELMPDFFFSYFYYSGPLEPPSCSAYVIWMQFTRPIRIDPDLVGSIVLDSTYKTKANYYESETLLQIEDFRKLKTFDGSPIHYNFQPLELIKDENHQIYLVVRQKTIPFVDAWIESGAKLISFSNTLMLTIVILYFLYIV